MAASAGADRRRASSTADSKNHDLLLSLLMMLRGVYTLLNAVPHQTPKMIWNFLQRRLLESPDMCDHRH